MAPYPKLIDKLYAEIPASACAALRSILTIADRRRVSAYLVGGPERDLLIKRPIADLDICLEGDAMALAREAAGVLGVRAVLHPSFLTATLKLDHFAIDLATARTETYARAGALPVVRPASIAADLLRRDFSINAMALRLNGPVAAELLDLTGGLPDLRAGVIRALHEESFSDDGTRMFRAARYEARFSFRIEERTAEWIRSGGRHLMSISGTRLRRELSFILNEPDPERALLRLDDLSVLRSVQRGLGFNERHASAFRELRRAQASLPPAYWPALALGLTNVRASALARRLALPGPARDCVVALPRLTAKEATLGRPRLRRSAAVGLLSEYPIPAIWTLAASTYSQRVRERSLDYLRKARLVRPRLRGDDVLRLGVAGGPAVGAVLRALLAAKLDGAVTSPSDEERFVRSFAERQA